MFADDVHVIKEISEDDGWFSILCDDSVGFGLSKEYGVTPKVGDSVTLYTVNFSEIRGMDLNGKRVFYKSDEQIEKEHADWLENNQREKEERFVKEKAQLDKDYESLPDNFKARIDKFRRNNPNFRVDYEAYEIFTIKEALKIARACKTPYKVRSFIRMSYETQMKIVPDLSNEHSGNTFDCACALAYWHLEKPEMVIEAHGALSPLVGSKAYGDVPA